MGTRFAISWLAALLVLCFPMMAVSGVAELTASDMATIRNPEMSSDIRLLLRFEPVDELQGAHVDLAILEFPAAVSCQDGAPGLTLDAFAATSPWSGQNAGWDQGWDAPGGDVDSGTHAVWTVAASDTARIRFDVTDRVNSWLRDELSNNGLMVRVARGETGMFSFRYIDGYTSAVPSIAVWYTPYPSR